MKKILLVLCITISLFSSEYEVDKDYSSIKFKANKLLFVNIDGEFSNFNGKITLNEKKEISKIDGVVFINSIDTKDEKRDEHLKANDYFFIKKFPNITFKSNKIINNIVKAKITIKGIERVLDFKISDFSSTNNALNFTLTSTINRQNFLLNGSMSSLFADNIDVIANINAVKK